MKNLHIEFAERKPTACTPHAAKASTVGGPSMVAGLGGASAYFCVCLDCAQWVRFHLQDEQMAAHQEWSRAECWDCGSQNLEAVPDEDFPASYNLDSCPFAVYPPLRGSTRSPRGVA